MKRSFITILAVLMLGISTQGGWFSHAEEEERSRAQQLETQLHQQQESTNTCRTASFALGLGCVLILIIETAIGSKGRRDAQRKT